jgi:hypothetical protein
MPGLRRTGFSSERRIYHFGYQRSRFIFLDSGKVSGSKTWDSCCPGFSAQMQQMEKWLSQAVSDGYRRAFIFINRPPYCLTGAGLSEAYSPHPSLQKYAGRLDICVISGGVATTELYEKDNVRYLVLGGGGGLQQILAKTPPAGIPGGAVLEGLGTPGGIQLFDGQHTRRQAQVFPAPLPPGQT